MEWRKEEWIRQGLSPSGVVSYFENLKGGRHNKHGTITSERQAAIIRHWRVLKGNSSTGHLNDITDAGSYSGMLQTLRTLEKQNIKDFDCHHYYLVGNRYLADNSDSRNQTLAAVIASEESLLNIARSQLEPLSNGAIVHIDTMFRVDKNGWGIIVFGTRDRGQKHHNIAYCYSNRDTARVHEFAQQVIINEVERLVEERIQRDGGIWM
jgi:hypothetical protein